MHNKNYAYRKVKMTNSLEWRKYYRKQLGWNIFFNKGHKFFWTQPVCLSLPTYKEQTVYAISLTLVRHLPLTDRAGTYSYFSVF